MTSIIFQTDSYKSSHFKQYPPGTEYIHSYIESRGGKFDETMFFGLQMFVRKYLCTPITKHHIDSAESIFEPHGVPFNRAMWEHILHAHNGYLPLKIRAVEEGSIVPVKNVLVTVVNTDPLCAPLTSYIETALLRAIWYPTTVATYSRECRKIIKKYLDKTSENSEWLDFKLHDFGARGVSSSESAGIGGLAHLAAGWQGSDTIEALVMARRYYYEDMAAYSIPAAEHSTITSWGKDGEADAYKNMLEQFPEGLVAVVSDSYDLFNAIDNIWGGVLKEDVQNRKGTLVIRPDSGNPLSIVLQTMNHLFDVFGFSINNKGYKVLPHYLKVMQGDGVSISTIESILKALEAHQICTDNIAFGMGGELLQIQNRDDQRFAMKCSAIEINGKLRDVFKDPVTDPGKTSKKGVLNLVKDDNDEYMTVTENDSITYESQLKTYYLDGVVYNTQTLAEIRERAKL